MIIASTLKITTDFILLLMLNYPISNPLSNGPKNLLLQYLCLIILVILYFLKVPLSPIHLWTLLTPCEGDAAEEANDRLLKDRS